MSNKKLQAPWNGSCPHCNTPKAYCGFNTDECINRYCKNYNSKHEQSVNDYIESVNNRAKQYENSFGGYYMSEPITFDNLFDEYRSVDDNSNDSNDTNDSSNADYDDSDQPLDLDFSGCPF